MKVTRFENPKDFAEIAMPILAQNEAINNLPIGALAGILERSPSATRKMPFLAIIEGEGDQYVALMTPPFPLIVTEMPDRAIAALVEYLVREGIDVGYSNGLVVQSDLFAELYSERTRKSKTLRKRFTMFEIDRVIPPRPAVGAMRQGVAEDMTVVTSFWKGFLEEAGMPHSTPEQQAEWTIGGGFLRLWIADDTPVAMASARGSTPNGIRIIGVYTPPENRGMGYASNLTAALTQELLDGGRKFCFLFTDQANPVSNSIYQKIGYRPIADTHEWRFE